MDDDIFHIAAVQIKIQRTRFEIVLTVPFKKILNKLTNVIY